MMMENLEEEEKAMVRSAPDGSDNYFWNLNLKEDCSWCNIIKVFIKVVNI